MKTAIKAAMTFTVIFLAVIVAWGLVVNAPVPEQVEREEVATAIRVTTIEKNRVRLNIRSQGNVVPRMQSEVVPEVSGRVQWISPNLVAGGYFKEDEVLLRIDDLDYRSTVDRRKATLDRAQAEAEHARFELQRIEELVKNNLASQSNLETQIRSRKIADAALKDAEIALVQAQRELWRTQIRAPYDGLVRNEKVDTGQFVSRGQSIASIYSSDSVEVRLPVADSQLAYLEIPLGMQGQIAEARQPNVSLSTEYGGKHYEWEGKLVRTEAEIDSRSRMVTAIVRVIRDNESEQPPLPVGLFVQAEIEGRWQDQVVSLPRAALRNQNQVLIVDNDNRLRYRNITLLRFDQDNVLISSGLQDGETVNLSPIQTVIDGMRVKPVVSDAVVNGKG